jgi:hypothetical protein
VRTQVVYAIQIDLSTIYMLYEYGNNSSSNTRKWAVMNERMNEPTSDHTDTDLLTDLCVSNKNHSEKYYKMTQR